MGDESRVFRGAWTEALKPRTGIGLVVPRAGFRTSLTSSCSVNYWLAVIRFRTGLESRSTLYTGFFLVALANIQRLHF